MILRVPERREILHEAVKGSARDDNLDLLNGCLVSDSGCSRLEGNPTNNLRCSDRSLTNAGYPAVISPQP